MDVTRVLSDVAAGARLGESQSEGVFDAIFSGAWDPSQIGALLAMLQIRGVTGDELTGAARSMRKHVTRVPPPRLDCPFVLLDTCGTGGAPKSFNVSTAAAIVAAAAGDRPNRPRVLVAKHGNRSRTGRGSAEVLAALGVNVDASPEVQRRCLEEVGVCFCFAIHHHPAMRHAAAARKALGFPTIFNLLGPLTNPAGATRQLLGVYDARLAPVVAEALARLGTEHALVVHSRDGLDEVSTLAPTDVLVVRRAGETWGVRAGTINPAELSIPLASPTSLAAGDVAEAATILRDALSGVPGPRFNLVALNAAAALNAAEAGSIHECHALASETMLDGRAARTLERLVDCSRS